MLPRLSVGKEQVLCFPSLVQTNAFVRHSMGSMAVALEVWWEGGSVRGAVGGWAREQIGVSPPISCCSSLCDLPLGV